MKLEIRWNKIRSVIGGNLLVNIDKITCLRPVNAPVIASIPRISEESQASLKTPLSFRKSEIAKKLANKKSPADWEKAK